MVDSYLPSVFTFLHSGPSRNFGGGLVPPMDGGWFFTWNTVGTAFQSKRFLNDRGKVCLTPAGY